MPSSSMRSDETARPKSFRFGRLLVAILALVQVIRLGAIPLIQSVLEGKNSDAWLFPAMTDVVVAAGAPFAAFVIWRKRGLGTWTYSVVWFVVSIMDHLDAITAGVRSENPTPFPASDAALVIQLAIMSLLELSAVIWLVRPVARAYYLDR